jgi:ubiquinone/menaquinone biosynthesis C-methylase UbiE
VTDIDPLLDNALEAEFDTVAGWTPEAVLELGAEFAIPAACRGSGTPAALEWLADRLGLAAGVGLLDVGAGVGGPAAFAAQQFEVRPTLVEPMFGACAAARDLFALPVVTAVGETLPIRTASCQAAWSLGVLCTTKDQPGALAELRRVTVPGGRVGLLVYVKTVQELPDQPDGNAFPTEQRLAELLDGAGLQTVEQCDATQFGVPETWQARADAVAEFIAVRHAQDRRWITAEHQRISMVELLRAGLVQPRLLVVTP